MILQILSDNKALATTAAENILTCVKAKPNAVLCLTSGETPRLTYHKIVELARKKHIDFSQVTFFALDEWLGIPTTNLGSCHYFLMENLLSPLGISQKQFHFFDGLTQKPQQVCDEINMKLQQFGGLDLDVCWCWIKRPYWIE